MKVFFDCIVTQELNRCSTVVQFVTLAEKLLKETDCFIYWPIPNDCTDEELDFLPKSPRIKYFPVFMTVDRMKEYNRMPEYLYDLMYFHGDCWDWDVCVTVRSCQVPWMRIIATSPRERRMAWTKRILIIEDMMVLSAKPSVSLSNPETQDRMTIEGYLAADEVFMPAYHQMPWLNNIARQYFAPSQVRSIAAKTKEVCHLNMPDYALKAEPYDGSRKFEVAFVGRTSRHASRLDRINELFVKQFIMHSDTIHPFVCTVSNSSRGLNDDVIDIYRPNREEFHKIARERMDLAVYFYVDVELNMSLLEPLSMGVPVLVPDAPWSRGMVGPNYPFFTGLGTQAYAAVLDWQKNYEAKYALFAEWFKNWFIPTYNKRKAEDDMYERLVEGVVKPFPDLEEKIPSLKENQVVKEIDKIAATDIKLPGIIEEGGKEHFGSLPAKVGENWRSNRSLVWCTPWNSLRLALKRWYGFEDASIECGHLKRKQ